MKNKIIPLLAMLAVIAAIAAFYILSSIDLSAADRTTSKLGNPASPKPQAYREFRYEMATKWNKGVDDLDSLYAGKIDTIRAEAVGIGITTPEAPFHFYQDYLGIAMAKFENPNAGAAAVVGTIVQIVNDEGYWGATGMTNSGSTILGGTLANTYQNYNQGYGDFLFTNDGAVCFRWFSDPADNHDFTALNNEIMTLTDSGYLSVVKEVDASFITIDSAWEDLRFAAAPGQANPVTDKPDFNFDEIGFLFPQADSTEIVYMAAQLPHAYIEGSDIGPHIHWKQDDAAVATWVMAYKWFNIGADPDTVPWDTIRASVGEQTYVSGSLHQITELGLLDGTGKTKSSLMSIKIWRNDNDLTGDALYYEFDIHHKKDKLGSREEYE